MLNCFAVVEVELKVTFLGFAPFIFCYSVTEYFELKCGSSECGPIAKIFLWEGHEVDEKGIQSRFHKCGKFPGQLSEHSFSRTQKSSHLLGWT
jgi:hypothetical protein